VIVTVGVSVTGIVTLAELVKVRVSVNSGVFVDFVANNGVRVCEGVSDGLGVSVTFGVCGKMVEEVRSAPS